MKSLIISSFLLSILAAAHPRNSYGVHHHSGNTEVSSSTSTADVTLPISTSDPDVIVSATAVLSDVPTIETSIPINSNKATKSIATQSIITTASIAPSAIASSVATDLWQPAPGTKFQIVLSDLIDPSVTIEPSDVPIFDIDMFNTPADTIAALKAQGKKVICYFSAGTAENWRPDYDQFTSSDLGGGVCEDTDCSSTWPGELWLNVKPASGGAISNVWKIMQARIEMAAQKGCDAVDPDNMGKFSSGCFFSITSYLPSHTYTLSLDAYNNQNGLGITQQDDIDYFTFLANTAHANNIGIGLKNALEMLPSVISLAQFAVNEQCAAFSECDMYSDFVSSKAVFHIEYTDSINTNKFKRATMLSSSPLLSKRASASSNALSQACDADSNFSTVIKTSDLNGVVQYCDGQVVTTQTTN